jgi:hypothetical protein
MFILLYTVNAHLWSPIGSAVVAYVIQMRLALADSRFKILIFPGPSCSTIFDMVPAKEGGEMIQGRCHATS